MATEKRMIYSNDIKERLKSDIVLGETEKAFMRNFIDNAHTVDAVEVVRCGECKHFCEPFCIRRDDETHRERINMLTVDFCSYGERKDNG